MIDMVGFRRERAKGVEAAPRRPDIVLVMTDQQRHDQTGYASAGTFETPAIDRWAGRATIFDQAYSASTTCVPARVSLLTGLDAHRVPVQEDGLTMQEGFWNVAHELRAAGYQTALVGKMHFKPSRANQGFEVMRTCEHFFPADFTPERLATREGFDDYHDSLLERGVPDWRQTFFDRRAPGAPLFALDAVHHPTNWVADEAIEVLRRRDPDRPLFLVVSFPHPHEPHNPPEPYESMYDRADIVLPTDGFEVNERLPEAFVEGLTQSTGVWAPVRPRSDAYLREFLALTRGLIRHIDDATERVLAHIDRSTTVTAFTSDHGDYAGHRGLIRKIPWIPFEDLIRVPLVIDAPDVATSQRIDSLVSSADLTLTFLDYAGVEIDPTIFDSRSLRPLLTGRAGPADRDRTLTCAPSSGWPTIRSGPYKLITRQKYLYRALALFDLDADPGETTDLAEHPRYHRLAKDLESELIMRLFRPIPDLPLPSDDLLPIPVDAAVPRSAAPA